MHDSSPYTLIDYAIFAGYLLAVIGAGFWRRQAGADAAQRYLAGRIMTWPLIGVSLMVTLASSIGFVAAPTAGYQAGGLMLWSLLAIPLAIPLVCLVFIPFYYRLRVYTAYEYLERRFSLPVRLAASGLFILWRLVWMAATLHIAGMVIQVVSGGAVSRELSIVGLGVIAALYTSFGGMRAVIWTDLVQFFVLFGGVAAVFYALAGCAPEGLGAWLGAAIRPDGPQALFPALSPPPGDSVWALCKYYCYADFSLPAIILAFTIGKIGNYGVDQVMVQRYLCAPSVRAAQKGFLFNTIIFALFFALMTLLGMLLAVGQQQGLLSLPPNALPDKIFPLFLARALPRGVRSLVIAAIIAAAMSSFDSGVHACVTAWNNDFWQRLRRGGFNLDGAEATSALGRLMHVPAVLLLGGFVMLTAFYLESAGDAFTIALKILNSFLGPLLALFLLALFSRRATSCGALAGLLMGSLLSALIILAPVLAKGVHPAFAVLDIGFLWTSVAGFALAWAGGYSFSLLGDPPSKAQQGWTFFAQRKLR